MTNWNTPNKITAARIVLSLFVFVALHFQAYFPALVCFVLAATTDWVDGYIARKYNLVTQLGRVLDPLADKLVICGTFIFLAAVANSGIAAWVAVVVTARELIVTVIRSFLEKEGHDFSANLSGKIKMVFQCAAAIASLLMLISATWHEGPPAWLPGTTFVLAMAAVASTLWSGIVYVVVAAKILKGWH